MAASISMSVLVETDDIDNAKVTIGDDGIPTVRFYGADGTVATIQGYHVDPHDFAFAIRHLGDRLVQAADDWAENQARDAEAVES